LPQAENKEKSDAMLSAARDSFWNSYLYSHEMLDARYNAARCKALMGDTSGALKDLEAVIKGDERYCIKAALDSDFDAIRDAYLGLIVRMRDEEYALSASTLKKVYNDYRMANTMGVASYMESADVDQIRQCVALGSEDLEGCLDMRHRRIKFQNMAPFAKEAISQARERKVEAEREEAERRTAEAARETQRRQNVSYAKLEQEIAAKTGIKKLITFVAALVPAIAGIILTFLSPGVGFLMIIVGTVLSALTILLPIVATVVGGLVVLAGIITIFGGHGGVGMGVFLLIPGVYTIVLSLIWKKVREN
jgi:uncharacterized membrane protein